MTSPPFILALVFMALQLVFGLLDVRGNLGALPAWFWGMAALTGLLGYAGALLQQSADPSRPYWMRALLIGLGWSLPFTSFMVARDLLRDEFVWFSVPLLLGMGTLFYGAVMAAVQNGTRKS